MYEKAMRGSYGHRFERHSQLFVRRVSKPLNAKRSEAKMTVRGLILWNNLVGSLWTSILSSSAYGRWFKRLNPLLTGEWKSEPVFFFFSKSKCCGRGPCFGLQFKFLVYKQCRQSLFGDKGAGRVSSLSLRAEICLHIGFSFMSDAGWHYLLVTLSLHTLKKISSVPIFPKECFCYKPPAWHQEEIVYPFRQINKHVTDANKKEITPQSHTCVIFGKLNTDEKPDKHVFTKIAFNRIKDRN